jgi:predicted metal-binding protein
LQCKACSREAGKKEFCPVHLKAYENIVEKYAVWRKALKISWEAYLSEIEKNSLTGNWAKEVAKYLMSKEEGKNGEEI